MNTQLGRNLADLSFALDEDLHVHGDVALQLLRVAKLQEEAGEAMTALLGYQGSNPRKGRVNGVAEIKKELLDVAITALGAWEHFDENRGRSGEALLDRSKYVRNRYLEGR